MGDFRKKYSADYFRGEKTFKDITGKNNILPEKNVAHDVYNAEKKNPRVLYVRKKYSNSSDLGKKILNQAKSPVPPVLTKVTWSAK